jgi:hypothetical protein
MSAIPSILHGPTHLRHSIVYPLQPNEPEDEDPISCETAAAKWKTTISFKTYLAGIAALLCHREERGPNDRNG